MKIVLVADVAKLGKRGEVVTVADGYARNYLLPKGLALEATPANRKRFEAEERIAARRREREAAEARAAAEKLEGVNITITAKAGEGGRLFGSVTSKDKRRPVFPLTARASNSRNRSSLRVSTG